MSELQSNSNVAVVGLVFIDNYDELIDSTEYVRRALLIAVIERKLNQMASSLNGFIRKFENDKYLLVFDENKVSDLIESKFEILKAINEINMGNSIPATLSIGIGLQGETLNQCMEFARSSIDLALSRGGDQAVIKSPEGYLFFGGKNKEVGTNSRVRARVKAYVLSEMISISDKVIVVGHKNPDLDCLGASVGICNISNALNKKCCIVLNEVSSSIKPLYDRLVSEGRYAEGVFVSGKEALEMADRNTLIVVVDNHRRRTLECENLLDVKGARIAVFDHHRKCMDAIENYAMIYHEAFASSTCELVTEMLTYIDVEIKLSSAEADALLAGITVDTKHFAFKTGTKTFEAAAFLKRKGADTTRVNMLFKTSIEDYRARALAVSRAEILDDELAITVVRDKVENPNLIVAQAADELLKLSGVEASFVLYESESLILISARSLGRINVQLIMEKLGGGGHQTGSAVQLKNEDIDLDKAISLLKEKIYEYLQEEK